MQLNDVKAVYRMSKALFMMLSTNNPVLSESTWGVWIRKQVRLSKRPESEAGLPKIRKQKNL